MIIFNLDYLMRLQFKDHMNHKHKDFLNENIMIKLNIRMECLDSLIKMNT